MNAEGIFQAPRPPQELRLRQSEAPGYERIADTEPAAADEEAALIGAAKRGDSEAFGVIVRRYMPRAIAFARQMTGNSDDAQDLAQDAFIRAYRGLGSFKGDSRFYTWFVKVLSNVCLDHLRKAALIKKVFFFMAPREDEGDEQDLIEESPDSNPASMPDSGLAQKELRAALKKALAALPDRQRAVFLLKHEEGLKLNQIAEALGISEGAVKSHLFRAVEALKKSMKGYGSHG
ncbi:MAG: RNA polymerase sigma factor [Nitrospirota bacterium]